MDSLISRQAAIEGKMNLLVRCDDDKLRFKDFVPVEYLQNMPSAEPKTSRIEQELHGKTPEEQYEFIYWLLFKSALNYSNSRLTIIEWLRGEEE